MFTSSNICNHTPPSTSPSPWQLLAGIKSERTGTNEMWCRNGRLLQVLRVTKKKSNLFLSAFFFSLSFYRREEDQEGDEEDEDEKKRKKRRPLNEEGEQRSRSSNLEEQRDKDRNLTREPV